MEPLRYHTLGSLNRQIYFLGLTPLQFSVGFFLPFFLFLANPFAGIITAVLIVWLGRIIYKNQKDGNPDYFESRITYMQSPKVIEDGMGVINYLVRN